MNEDTQQNDIAALRKKIKNLKHKRGNRNRRPLATDKGAYLIARDYNCVFARKRHTQKDTAITEIKRLAKENSDRFLLLKVVGILDKRPKT